MSSEALKEAKHAEWDLNSYQAKQGVGRKSDSSMSRLIRHAQAESFLLTLAQLSNPASTKWWKSDSRNTRVSGLGLR